MPATARRLNLTREDLERAKGGGGLYSEIEVPGDYEAVLVDVNDYDNRFKGGTNGWIFEYEVTTPTSQKQVTFKEWISFSENARWKLAQVFDAHEVDYSEGLDTVDPNELIGDAIGARIDFPRDKDDEPTSKYREIVAFFPIVKDDEVPTL